VTIVRKKPSVHDLSGLSCSQRNIQSPECIPSPESNRDRPSWKVGAVFFRFTGGTKTETEGRDSIAIPSRMRFNYRIASNAVI
jgi:hypothetical protein